MQAGYSGKPLIKKLGIKEGYSIAVLDPPDDHWNLLGRLPASVVVTGPGDSELDSAHVFVTAKADLERHLPGIKDHVKPQGMIWVSWPKKSSGVSTDLTENVIRDIALATGLVDVKVCAVDQTWSGLKLVTRLEDRV